MSTSHSPMAASVASVVGEPLTNWRFVPGAGERAFEDELVFLARFQAVFVQKALFQRRAGRRETRHVKDGLDGAAFLAAADERAVGAFAEDEVERADDDGLARAGFAGDDIAAGLEFQREVAHQGEGF
jgi:hypothetical protein